MITIQSIDIILLLLGFVLLGAAIGVSISFRVLRRLLEREIEEQCK